VVSPETPETKDSPETPDTPEMRAETDFLPERGTPAMLEPQDAMVAQDLVETPVLQEQQDWRDTRRTAPQEALRYANLTNQ